MPDLALLNSELEDIAAKRALIRDKHKGATMPEEARREDESYTERARKIVFLIEEEKQKARDSEFDQISTYMNEPHHVVPRSLNADDEGRRLINRAGWDIKNGMIYAPTSLGKQFAMYPEEVLFGPMPEKDNEAGKYFRQTRAIFQPEYRTAYLNWLRSPYRNDGMAFSMLPAAEQNALSEGADGAGGFVVPPDVMAEIMVRRGQDSVMRQLATVRQTSRDQVAIPAIAPSATAADRNIYTNGFVGTWVGETPAFSETDPTFEQFIIGIKKVRVATKMSNDWLADAVGNMLGQLSESGARNLALVEDKGFIAGAGTALEPLGILNHSLARTATSSNGMAYDVEGSTSNTISNSASDAGSAPKIKALTYTLPSQYVGNASWLMSRAVQGKVAALVDANGRPFWNSYLDSGFGRPQMQIEGAPVYNSEFVGADGAVSTTAATTPLIFGDISAYQIVERTQISTIVLRERFADTDQTGIILMARVGGGLWNYDAIRTGYIAS